MEKSQYKKDTFLRFCLALGLVGTTLAKIIVPTTLAGLVVPVTFILTFFFYIFVCVKTAPASIP